MNEPSSITRNAHNTQNNVLSLVAIARKNLDSKEYEMKQRHRKLANQAIINWS